MHVIHAGHSGDRGLGQLSTGGLAVVIVNVPVGWYYYFVVVY
jgi:hypothetical protein